MIKELVNKRMFRVDKNAESVVEEMGKTPLLGMLVVAQTYHARKGALEVDPSMSVEEYEKVSLEERSQRIVRR